MNSTSTDIQVSSPKYWTTTAPVNCIIQPTSADPCSKRNWNTGVSMPIKLNLAVGWPTPLIGRIQSTFLFSDRFDRFLSSVSFRDTQDVLVGLDRLDLDAEPITEEEIPHKFGWDYDSTIRHKNMSLQEYMKTLPWFKRVQPRVWQLFEEPYSSSAAKVSVLSLLLRWTTHWDSTRPSKWCPSSSS